jgi:monovalent cation:H+ antiporter-2, CPA2 family
MHHDVNLIATIAWAFGIATVLGLIASRLRLPPLLGYLLAGIVIGPFTPGYVGDQALAGQLAEIGVMLLMFGVGLHFSVDDLLKVKGIALPGALLQIAVTVALGAFAALAWGWSMTSGLVFGLCLSVASTVVLLRALEGNGQLATPNGQIAMGWLVVEDLVMVFVLVLIPALADAGSDSEAMLLPLLIVLGKVALFVVLMLTLGRRLLPRTLWWLAETGSPELFRLGVTAVAISIAFAAAELFAVSFALGAFFAGMMLRESEFSQRAAEETLPLRDAFAVLFFVSVGMLIDPSVLWQAPLALAVTVLIIVVGKTLVAVALVLALRYPPGTAITVGISLAQIGEFSFILAGLAVTLNLLPTQAQSLVVAGAVISIALNPALFRLAEPLRQWFRKRSGRPARLDRRQDLLDELTSEARADLPAGHVIVLGFGRVGSSVGARLGAADRPFIAVDTRTDTVAALRAAGVRAVVGDATAEDTLRQAQIGSAEQVVIALDNPVTAHRAALLARELNPGVELYVRAQGTDEAQLHAELERCRAFVPESALGYRMGDEVLARSARELPEPR